MFDMRRREFVTFLGSAAVAWPLAARAQQAAMPVIGFLRNTTAAGSTHLVGALRQGLSEAGFIEGQNVAIEYRWADDHQDRLPGLAADLVRRQVSIIVANANSTPAAKAATSTIPIVFVAGGDPVDSGLVASLNRPGGNVTGVTFTSASLDAKRLQLLLELAAKDAIIAVLLDPNASGFETELRDVEQAARFLGRKLVIVKAGSEREFDAAFANIVQAEARALLLSTGPFFLGRRRQLVGLATRHALPAIYYAREFVEAGGLMSYGASQTDAYRRAGIFIGRILKGEKPSDLPVQLPTKYDLVINLGTAKALGLEVPATLLAVADEVIE
jgi:ABC-type uncharacterized transport system substrate-binding protein